MWMCHLVNQFCCCVYLSFMIRMSHAYSCTDLPSNHALTSYKLYMSNYSFATCYMVYICLSCLAQSNGATLGIIGEYLDATALEIHKEEESPRRVAEWTSDNVFQTSI